MLLIISCIHAASWKLALRGMYDVAGVLKRVKDFLRLLAVEMQELMYWLSQHPTSTFATYYIKTTEVLVLLS